jgi:hypothetical protein
MKWKKVSSYNSNFLELYFQWPNIKNRGGYRLYQNYLFAMLVSIIRAVHLT